MNRIVLFSVLIWLIQSGCEDTTSTQNQQQTTSTDSSGKSQPSTVDNRQPIWIQAVTPTSNGAGSDVDYLFDGNEKTYWRTPGGFGLEEGITIRFLSSKENYVEAIEVVSAQGTDFAPVERLDIAVNNGVTQSFTPNSRIDIGQNLQTLTITNSSVKEMTGSKKQTSEGEVQILIFPTNRSIGFAEIRFYLKGQETLRPVLPKKVKGTILASSTLEPASAYHTGHLFDGNPESAWVEGNSGDGRGEWLKIITAEPLNLSALLIHNGYQRSYRHFQQNGSVKQFSIELQGQAPQSYTLRQTIGDQRIELSPILKGNTFDIKILEANKGSKYKDMALSEWQFFEGDQPIVLETNFESETRKAIQAKSENTPLSGLLDRRFYNEMVKEDYLIRSSLMLRSDGSFTAWSSETTPYDDFRIWRAEGTWQMNFGDAASAKIKLSGTLLIQSNIIEAPDPAKKEIFSETVTLSKEKLSGGEVIRDFYFN